MLAVFLVKKASINVVPLWGNLQSAVRELLGNLSLMRDMAISSQAFGEIRRKVQRLPEGMFISKRIL